MSDLDIAIIGVSGAFPGAPDIDQFWDNLVAGRCALERLGEDDLVAAGVDPAEIRQPGYVPVGGKLGDVEYFDNEFFGISNRDAQLMDPQQRRFLQYAWQAFENAGYDISRFAGRVGVYAGISLNTYLTRVLLAPGAIDLSLDAQSVILGNLGDYLTTRLSYLLDLKGPSLNIQTACSTSLVAVHEACQGLLSYQADMALAGGCSITLPDGRGYVHAKDSLFSADGKVRAFDERASGTVFTNGVGLVVLRRRADAERDGDRVLAVIKATAVNNDGADKVGYAAPSISGQARAIADALELAGVSADDIQYVEAHGTGTELGDPVEIAALHEAFRTDRRQSCAIGSVKTNIGHTDVAAGAAGLIKTALALHHEVLPASLCFERPNPRLNLSATPFYVNATTRAWPAGRGRRLAGVSSFGIGGTNAHAVLEEAAPRAAGADARPAYCLTLSARTEESLRAIVARFTAFLRARPPLAWSDICFTSNVGRKAFARRHVIVAEDIDRAIAQLAAAAVAAGEVPSRALVIAAARADDRQAAEVERLLGALRESGVAAAADLGEASRDARACRIEVGREVTFTCEDTRIALVATSHAQLVVALVGLAWKHGVNVDWGRFYAGEQRARVAMPAYEFRRKRLWIDRPADPGARGAAANVKIEDLRQWFYKPVWRQAAISVGARDAMAGTTILIFTSDPASFANAACLGSARVVYVTPGREFAAIADGVYTIDPAAETSYRQLLDELRRRDALPRYVVHAWLVDRDACQGDAARFEACQTLGLCSLVLFVRQFAHLVVDDALSIAVAVSGLVDVSGAERVDPNKAPVLGATKTIPKEYPAIDCRAVDISRDDFDADPRSFRVLLDELRQPLAPENEVVAIRSGRRWRQFFERIEIPASCDNPVTTAGCYVVLGGLGELGLSLSGYLARRAPCALVLVNATPFLARTGWDAWIAEHGPDHAYSRKIEALRELEQRGARVELVQCDVADAAALRRTLDAAARVHGTLNAIVHAAGVVENGMIDQKDVARFAEVFRAKVAGTYNLLDYVRERPTPKLVLCSSMNSLVGGLGQIDNTAANAFLDAIAETRLAQSAGDVCAINWGAVNAERRFQPNVLPQFEDLSHEHKRNYMTEAEMYAVYDRILSWSFGPRLVLSTIDFATVLERWGEVSRVTELSRLRRVASTVTAVAPLRPRRRHTGSEVEGFVIEAWSSLLGVDELAPDDDLFAKGAHSLSAVQFASMLQDAYGVSMHAMNSYQFPRVADLARHVEKLVQERDAKARIQQGER